MSHGLSQENPADAVAEGDELGPDARRPDRITPGALDMTDHRQRAPLGMRQEPLRQARNEPLVGNRDWFLVPVGQEVVERRGPGAIAGEQEGHQTMESSVIGNVWGAEVITRANRAEPGPILTEECSLRHSLVLMSLGPAHAVRGREQERGPVRTRKRTQHLTQAGPGGFPPLETERAKALRSGDGFLLRLISGGRHPLVKRSDQEISTHLRGPIPGMARSPVDDLPAGWRRLRFLVIHHALGIQAILIGMVEAEAADGVLDIEQVLEIERDRLGTAD